MPKDLPWINALRISLLVALSCLCAQFQVYQNAVINNLFAPALQWLEPAEPILVPMVAIAVTNATRVSNETSTAEAASHSTMLLWSTYVAMFSVGKVIGTAASAFVADCLGRRKAGLVLCVLLAACALMLCVGYVLHSMICLLVARLLIGCGAGLFISVAILLAVECPPAAQRGVFTGLNVVFYGLGDFLGTLLSMPQLFGTVGGWGYVQTVSLWPSVACFVVLFIYPDSPRYLYLHKKDKQAAEDAVLFYQGDANLAATMEDLRADAVHAAAHGINGKFGYLDLFKGETLRPTLLSVLLTTMTQLSGVAIVLSYSTMVMTSLELDLNTAALLTFLLAAVKVVTSFPVPWLNDLLGRRWCVLLGTGGCTLSNMAAAMAIWLRLPHAGLTVGIVWTLHTIAYNLLGAGAAAARGELLPQKARASGLMLSDTWAWALQAIIVEVFPSILRADLTALCLLSLALLCIVSMVLICMYLPETRNIQLSLVRERMASYNTMSISSDKSSKSRSGSHK